MKSLNQISVFIVSDDRYLRKILKDVLVSSDIVNIRFVDDFETINHELDMFVPDIVICDLGVGKDEIKTFVKDVRDSKCPCHPFLSIFVASNDSDEKTISFLLDTAIDDLIIFPISAQKFISRINFFVNHNKSFVVEENYVGPKRPSHDEKDVKSFEIPNLLYEKIENNSNDEDIQEFIDVAKGKVNDKKLENYVLNFDEITNKITKCFAENKKGEAQIELKGLQIILDDTMRRLVNTKYGYVSGLCVSLREVVLSLLEAETKKDMDLMILLSKSIKKGFDEGAEAIAKDIADLVDLKH
jgi:DNA-binding response OmpR family regulator